MARILLAWELGHGLGHIVPMRALALRLIGNGHEVLIAAREILRVRAQFSGVAVRILAAPFFAEVVLPTRQQSSLADVIWFDAGGHQENVLVAQFLAWRELIAQLRIDLVVADAAPIAVAASRGLTRSLAYESYFHACDRAAWGVFRDWERVDTAASAARAQSLLSHVNSARVSVGLAAVSELADAFAATRTWIRFLPEHDYAHPRTDVQYLLQETTPGLAADWPRPDLPQRIFAYLRKGYPYADRIVHALARLTQCSVLCFHDGLPAEKLRQAEHVRYSDQAFDLNSVLPDVDAVVCHGGGVQILATQFGKPALMIPAHTEQFLSARAAAAAGSGLLFVAKDQRPDFLPSIRQILTKPEFAEAAQRIASANRDGKGLSAVVEDIELQLAQPIESGES